MQAINSHTTLSEEVIKTLLYFDIFNYPLKAPEVLNFLRVHGATETEVKHCIDELVEQRRLYRFGDLYGLNPDEQNAERRIKGNREAEKWLEVAKRQARLISRFPFIRSVMASGSLSKGYMDETSDLDFFVVTAPNRLWIARALIALYKRIFLLNSHKKFCVNYFIDTLHLEIEEKNLFTATELATLIPLYNHQYYELMLASNKWLRDFLPNYRGREADTENFFSPAVQTSFEFLLTPFAPALDKWLMQMALRRWKRLYENKFDKRDFAIAFKTRPHVSKNHPKNFQRKILDLYQVKMNDFATRSGGTL